LFGVTIAGVFLFQFEDCAMPWPCEVRDVRYPSTADHSEQPAKFYAPGTRGAAPLLVALHPWSFDYDREQSAPYAEWCMAKGWVFIHPSFRGPNVRPEAMGSELVVKDIVSAVDFARGAAKVDERRIYLMGASGGGYASLLMAGRAPEIWAGVSAYVPIIDLAAWYKESAARKSRYADNIAAACGGAPGASAAVDEEYRRRSAATWLANAGDVAVDINAGIHDGHTGSVPISHTLRAFNILAAPEDRLTEEEIRFFVEQEAVPPHLRMEIEDATYGAKKPLFRRSSRRARVTIFEGGHDELFGAGLAWLERQRRG